ncbi:MAG: hypothetical protein K6G80_03075 [Treponema sp.]|nr:hypothetical protein [Treponema sp.]
MTLQEKRIARVSSRPLTDFSTLKAYVIRFTHPRAICTTIRFFIAVIRNYLVRQYAHVWHLSHVPVIHVDHPLDKTVPFLPQKVSVYFRFIDFWIEPLTMLTERFGLWKGVGLGNQWLEAIKKTYQSAGKVYAGYLSTTDRPDYKGDKLFKLIHGADPHLLCVPSLHIAIVVLCFTFFRDLFEREQLTEAEKTRWNQSLYAEAVAIAESVLFVKQHSVNCIPAAFYMMTAQFPDLVKPRVIEAFIDDMFKTSTPEEISPDNAKAVRAHILFTYRAYLEKAKTAGVWYEPIREWLSAYKRPQTADAQES